MRLKPWSIAMPQRVRSSGVDTAAAASTTRRGVAPGAAEPVDECAAAERHADRVQGAAGAARADARVHRVEHRADLLVVAGVVGARRAGWARRRSRGSAGSRRASRGRRDAPSARGRSASRSCPRGRERGPPSARQAPVAGAGAAGGRPSRDPRNRRRACRRVRAGSATSGRAQEERVDRLCVGADEPRRCR